MNHKAKGEYFESRNRKAQRRDPGKEQSEQFRTKGFYIDLKHLVGTRQWSWTITEFVSGKWRAGGLMPTKESARKAAIQKASKLNKERR